MTVGQRIKKLRYGRGWGPEALADRAHVSRSSVYELETGRVKRPRASTIHLLAMALEVSVAELLGLEDVPGFRDEATARQFVQSVSPAVDTG